jgi:hypothetical protein
MAQSGVPANNFAHNRNSIAQNSSAPAASSNPAAQQTSQPSGSSSSDQADSQPSAFMAALISATLDDSGSNLLAKPLATAGANSTIVNGRRLNTLKQPSRIGNQEALAVAVPTSLTTPPVLPLRFSLPSRDPEEDSIPDGDNAASNSGAQADNASEPAKRTADAATAAESQANSSEELTFAARVQPAKPVTEPAFSTASSSGANVSNATSGAADVAPSAAPSTASTLFAPGAMAAFRQNDQIAATPQTAATPPSQPVEAIAPAFPKPAAAPLQDISLQVGQAGSPKVEIRMVQQSGELQVAVRTGDSDLSHGLQQGLSDLVGRLQESGFRAEAWRPAGLDSHSATVVETKSSSESSQSGDSQPGNSGSRQESGQRQQNPSRRPAWVDELEARMNNQRSTGESYGIRN